MFIFMNSVLCSTLKEFIDINSREITTIYTQSRHSISSMTPNNYPVPRLSCPGGVLPYMGYIGTCRGIVYGF